MRYSVVIIEQGKEKLFPTRALAERFALALERKGFWAEVVAL